MKFFDSLQVFFQNRYKLGPLSDLLTHKTVPVHRHTFWYYWGGMTLILIVIQILSGLLLLLYYRPSAQEAFESVRFIMTKVEFGWLIRSVHAWAANLVIFSAFVHLASTFFLKAYRPPRELTWVTGVCLFFLLLGFGFTGYLLPWNTLAFFATKVGTEIAGVVPIVGPILQVFLRGGGDVGDVTLTRFFWFHIAVLPMGLLVLVGLHVLMVQLQGMSKPLSVKQEKTMPFFPNFFLRDLIAWVIALGVVLALGVYWPATLGEKADPFAPTPAGIQPEWYFLWMFQTLKLFPGHLFGIEGELLSVGLTGLAGFVLFLVPWLDRPARQGKFSWLVSVIGMLGLAYLVGMTGYALWVGRHP
ncbi:MAG: cytochrome bc complex cytochrome b subunit [Candidatus Omnitrophica bacterium]|nr:cytochrome bc complex cytochrome b subunit [Candidatus Omnitrophota bacterium]